MSQRTLVAQTASVVTHAKLTVHTGDMGMVSITTTIATMMIRITMTRVGKNMVDQILENFSKERLSELIKMTDKDARCVELRKKLDWLE